MGIKQERYTEAFSRIDSAISTKHYFEVITIEESIISDRIASFLVATEALDTVNLNNLNNFYQRTSFANLITLWKLATRNPGNIWENCDSLIGEVDGWRKQRNKYVHGLVKFPHQAPKIVRTKEFISGAKTAALNGKDLANQISEWRKRQTQIKRSYNRTVKA